MLEQAREAGDKSIREYKEAKEYARISGGGGDDGNRGGEGRFSKVF